MTWLIIFTIFVLCVLFWTGTLAAAAVGIGMLVFHTLRLAAVVVIGVFSLAAWCLWFVFRPKAALAEWRDAAAVRAARKASSL